MIIHTHTYIYVHTNTYIINNTHAPPRMRAVAIPKQVPHAFVDCGGEALVELEARVVVSAGDAPHLYVVCLLEGIYEFIIYCLFIN
jgi:hypothetical protein